MAHRLPLTQLYNVDLQYDLGHGWVADIGYVGSHSIHVLNQGTGINVAHLVGCRAFPGLWRHCRRLATPQDLAMLRNPNFPGGNPIPFNDPANATPVTVNTAQNVNARVSYLGYTDRDYPLPIPWETPSTTACKLSFGTTSPTACCCRPPTRGARTLRTSIALQSGELDIGQTDFGTSGSNNPLNFAQQYGPYSGERSQRLIVSYSYDLPWKSTEGLNGKLLGGWTISGITTLQNGQPMTVTDAGGDDLWCWEQSLPSRSGSLRHDGREGWHLPIGD